MPFSGTNVRTAVTELLEGTIGTVRSLASGVFVADVFDGQPLPAKQARTLDVATAPYRFDVELLPLERHDASPLSTIVTHKMSLVTVLVHVWAHLGTTVERSVRDSTKAAMASALDDAAQALAFPTNLAETSAAAATAIVSGMLRGPIGEGRPEVGAFEEDWGEHLLRATITGTAHLRIAY